MFKKKVHSVVNLLNRFSLKKHRFQNRKKQITIISRDCVGGMLYNQYGLQFLSPTINLFFTPEDFNWFCLHLKEYINGTVIEKENNEQAYPVGLLHAADENLKELTINFMHYNNFDEALKKWEERKKRIKWDSIFIVSTFCYPLETDTFSTELVNSFNAIKYKKVILVDKKYGFDGEYVIDKPAKCHEHAWLLFTPGRIIIWKKTFNKFNFDRFFKK